jgi:hypothetical protein
MAVDALGISAIIIAGLTALGGAIAGIHIKRMNSGCCNCETFNPDNSKNSPVNSPIKIKNIEEIIREPKGAKSSTV